MARSRRESWTTDRYWFALRTADKKQVAASLDCSLSNVYNQVRKFRAASPGGKETRLVVDRDNHRLMSEMMDEAHLEVLAAVAFISPSPPPVFDSLLAAARRGLDVKMLFRADNMTGALVTSLQEGGVDFRTMADLHAKMLITDTTALTGSANFTDSSATRSAEVGIFVSQVALVDELRGVFYDYWKRARPF